jgi:hypothetical protein
VQRVAREYLTPDGIAGVAYLPAQQGEDLTADRLRSGFE